MWVHRFIVTGLGCLLALWVGTWSGGLLRPGPADLLDGSRETSVAPVESPAFDSGSGDAMAAYGDNVPDYVIGTDWLGGKDMPVASAPDTELLEPETAPTPPPAPRAPVAPLPEAPPAASYPSQSGDILGGSGRPDN